jgi:hypothetical protein
MKKVLLSCLVLSLVVFAGMVMAQQTPAPAPEKAPASPPTVSAPMVPASAAKAAAPAAASTLTVSRFEICASVENRQPVGIAASFPATQEKIYCYLEFKNVAKDTTITYVWTLGLNEMGKVTQNVKKSWRFRTWANKSLNGMKGDWKVDVLDESGAVIKTASFKVE